MIRSSLFTRSALGLALALGLATGALTVSAPAEAQSKKEKKGKPPAKLTNSKEFVQAYIPLQTVLKAAEELRAKKAPADQIKTALTGSDALLAAAEAQVKNPMDRLVAGQAAYSIGQMLKDNKQIARGLNGMLDSGQLVEPNLSQVRFYVGNFAYEDKNYPRVIESLGPLVAANFSDDAAAELLAQAHVGAGQPAAGLDALSNAIKVREAAGGAVSARWMDRGVRIAFDNKLNNQVNEWARRRAMYTPSAFNWISAAQILRETGGFGDQESIDLSRMLFRAGALKEKSQAGSREYIEYLQAATGRVGILYPGEALKVAQAGIAAGSLNSRDVFVAEVVNEANKRLAADKASLPGLERDARAATAKPITMMAAGDVYLSYDMPAKAEELYKIALAKPGIDLPRVLTRLGIAQADQGKLAEANETFAKVEGTRKPIAQLWMAYLASKTRAAAAPAPSPAT